MPLTDIDIEFTFNGTQGIALVWVIDGDCLYDLPLSVEHAEIFLATNVVKDISDRYPEHDGIVVELFKDEQSLMELATTEYFGSILLSNPQAVRLDQYPFGRYVVSPNAKFNGEEFQITDRDVSGLWPWARGNDYSVSVAEV
jgi:hypothetical protein